MATRLQCVTPGRGACWSSLSFGNCPSLDVGAPSASPSASGSGRACGERSRCRSGAAAADRRIRSVQTVGSSPMERSGWAGSMAAAFAAMRRPRAPLLVLVPRAVRGCDAVALLLRRGGADERHASHAESSDQRDGFRQALVLGWPRSLGATLEPRGRAARNWSSRGSMQRLGRVSICVVVVVGVAVLAQFVASAADRYARGWRLRER